MTEQPGSSEIAAFYRASLVGLVGLERAGGLRRFDAEAEARWALFRGELEPRDRIDLLLRDAAHGYPLAFAPRAVFALDGLAGDEPFGAEWPGPEPVLAIELLRQASAHATAGATAPAARTVAEQLGAAARCWDLTPIAPPAEALAAIGPATRVLAAGAGSVLALAAHFEGRADLDLGDQVVLVSDRPGERQLFGLALAWLASRRPARCLAPDATADDARGAGIKSVDRSVVTPDASPAAGDAVARLGQALGAA